MSQLDVVAVNAKGGQAEGPPLASWAHDLKRAGAPLLLLLSEVDGPGGSTRIYDALSESGIRVFGHRHGETHGEREVAVGVVGASFKVHDYRVIQLTPNTNPRTEKSWQWDGTGQDRHLAIVEGSHLEQDYAVLSLHAPLHMFTKGRLNHTAQARHWRVARRKIKALVRDYRRRGYVVVLGGDLNETRSRRWSGTWRWCKRIGLRPFVTRVMWVAVAGARVEEHLVVDCPPAVSDHPTAQLVRLQVARHAK